MTTPYGILESLANPLHWLARMHSWIEKLHHSLRNSRILGSPELDLLTGARDLSSWIALGSRNRITPYGIHEVAGEHAPKLVVPDEFGPEI